MRLPKEARRLAGKIRVIKHADRFNLEIDGQEFPWFISDEGVNIGPISDSMIPTVQVTILTESLEVVQSLDKAPVDMAKR